MERKQARIDPAKVKPDDLMAIIYWVKVRRVRPDGTELVVCDLDKGNREFQVIGKELIESCLSGVQFSEEIKVTKTEAAEILISSFNRPFTVCFEKQEDKSERILRGRLIRHEALLGRSMVEDLDQIDPKDRTRLVDHRTLKSLVVDGIKYTVKSK